MKILVLDNYDSFTYNLVHIIKEITGGDVDVFRNDKIELAEIEKYDKIVLSPGPGVPDEAGILKPLIARYGATKSIFGVCLGCQAIAEVYGGTIKNLNKVYHGVATPVKVTDNKDITFKNVPSVFEAGRYHSWVVDAQSLPSELKVSAVDNKNLVMAVYHELHDVRGVQFHPESVLTPYGKEMLASWLNQERANA